jgi:hypothetical protein
LLGAVLVTIGGVWWFLGLPASARAALAAASSLNILMLLIFAVTLVVFAMLYLGPYRNPGWITPGFAILLFTFGLAAIGTGEFLREAIRKPYIVYGVVLSNQIFADEVPRLRQSGYLEAARGLAPTSPSISRRRLIHRGSSTRRRCLRFRRKSGSRSASCSSCITATTVTPSRGTPPSAKAPADGRAR